MPIIKKQKISSSVIAIIAATCVLLTAIVVIFFASRYQNGRGTPPHDTKQISPAKELDSTRQHQLQESDRQFLIAQGLQNPIHDLVQDLMKHNELIPCKGSVGGVPGFYNPAGITILSKSRVEAVYDDGHVEGRVELTFTVSNGVIRWKVKKVECGE